MNAESEARSVPKLSMTLHYLSSGRSMWKVSGQIILFDPMDLEHRQFKSFLEEVESLSSDLPYHTAIRWLCCGKILSNFFSLRTEI
ncbi:hypothetical protein PR048_002940 [Dryococelus australis]|uniref:Uncharacterized protein n=1 Tax=Dryococelus australis TaxID=614101 RepID=A0ABQ9IMN7_9NEOP|nr:hypothetical protein PR048_002940 [Dryococelus australis]